MRIYLITAITFLLQFSSATAMTVSGDILLLSAAPSDAGTGSLISAKHAFAWAEQSNISLTAPLSVDVIPLQNNAAGTYNSGKRSVQSAWSGTITSGSYDSFIVHADKSGKKAVFTGSITFDTDIAGLLFRHRKLVMTDVLLGAVGTTYAEPDEKRGFPLRGSKNWFNILPDQRTLEFQTVARKNINELRVLTMSRVQTTTVPLPASVWLFGSALCLLTWIKRRNQV